MTALRPALAAAFVLAASDAHAGPWTKSLGEAYVKLSEGVFLAGEFVDPRAQASADVDHASFTTALYAEVGIWERLHVQLYLPHVTGRNTFAGGYDYLSLGAGDVLAGLQWTPGLLDLPHAIRAEVKVPFYGLAPDPRFPARGDGQLDATIWLSLGRSLEVFPLYLYGELGHRFRTEVYPSGGDGLGFGDSFVFGAQAGVTIGGFVLAANAGGVVPYAPDLTTKGYVNLGGAAAAPLFAGFALEASVDGTVWARTSSRGIAATLGVSYKL